MQKQNLNKSWNLTYKPLGWNIERVAEVKASPMVEWLTCDLPCDIHTPLIENGIIKEPVEALNSFDAEWTEEKSWWFRKEFDADSGLLDKEVVELRFESLDVEADIFLNGTRIGFQRSMHYPFVLDVKRYLRPSGNELLVRLTAGAERYNQEEVDPYKVSVSKTYRRGEERRVFLRKPQYVFGWDWGPRIATCGIVGDVSLAGYDSVAVRGCHVVTASIGCDGPARSGSSQGDSTPGVSDAESSAQLDITVEVENLHVFRTKEAVVTVTITPPGNEGREITVDTETLLISGTNYIDCTVTVANARLWWPNGMGEQPLYTVEASCECEGTTDSLEPFAYGIRTLRLNLDKLGEGHRLFAFEINGVKTFCKGGNWIPTDSIYARVTDEKYDTLIQEAKEANFTMLRIWGGGIYEKEVFYKKCDEYGILVWHDFMYACAIYPDKEDWFREESRREIDYQTKRLRNYACMALWSGCNENNWGFYSWWIGEKEVEYPGGAYIYNQLAPRIVAQNSPNIPYWNGSPYGGDDPNGNEVGDRHHWHDCTMNEEMEKRITPEEYDKVASKFVSEYGYIGPCAKSTIEKYHGGEEIVRHSDLWNWHNNTFEKDTVEAGITKHYVDAEGLSLDEYLLYASLCQGLMYGYSLEAIRFKQECWGSIFWMYTDCWGEVGWTIVDYYLKRKPSYYSVMRTFAPVRFILREENGKVKVMGINDTPSPVELSLEYGYLSFDGKKRETEKTAVNLDCHSRTIVHTFQKADFDEKRGCYFVKPENTDSVLPAALRSGVFRDLDFGWPGNIAKPVAVSNVERNGDDISFTVSSDVYVHALHFPGYDDYRFSDNYFDLLPGESRTITLYMAPESISADKLPLRHVVPGRIIEQ